MQPSPTPKHQRVSIYRRSQSETQQRVHGAQVAFEVAGTDGDILARWLGELRPGTSKPRMLKEGVSLPAGCMSPGSFNELWHDAMDHVGVRMTPHMCRHAVATLILALEPGNWAKVAAVLGDTEKPAPHR